MTTVAAPEPVITGGVDTHLNVHVAAVFEAFAAECEISLTEGYNPWRHVAGHGDVLVVVTELEHADAYWEPDERVILLDRRLDQAQRRSCLAQELAHLEAGDSCCGHGRKASVSHCDRRRGPTAWPRNASSRWTTSPTRCGGRSATKRWPSTCTWTSGP